MVTGHTSEGVRCKDELGEYVTLSKNLDNGLADPNRYTNREPKPVKGTPDGTIKTGLVELKTKIVVPPVGVKQGLVARLVSWIKSFFGRSLP